MNIIIQPTGYGPLQFEVRGAAFYSHQQIEGEKRGVSLSLWDAVDADALWVAKLKYLTNWGSERSFTRFYSTRTPESMGKLIREAAKTMLPPGAGFPATPQYESRQAKLGGVMETLTLIALSDVLRQAADAKY